MCRAYSILPRQGEVAPKVTEGEDTEQQLLLTSPSVWQAPATSPWRGRIERFELRRQLATYAEEIEDVE